MLMNDAEITYHATALSVKCTEISLFTSLYFRILQVTFPTYRLKYGSKTQCSVFTSFDRGWG
jgi:hypothetical protein